MSEPRVSRSSQIAAIKGNAIKDIASQSILRDACTRSDCNRSMTGLELNLYLHCEKYWYNTDI
jgi:hypothetical protein